MIISVVIPCRNEANAIQSCIDAVYSSDLPPGYSIEVIVVDGESDAATQTILLAIQKQYPHLKILRNPQRITPVAFNLGIQVSTGNFIQIIGARQLIASDYLIRGIKRLESDASIWCVGGKVENTFANTMSRIIARAMDTPFGVGGGNFRILTQSGYVDTVGTPMYPRSVFERIGLFDEALIRNQDDELNYRITKAGGKIFLDIAMHVKYEVRASLSNLYRQYFQYGYWKVYVNRKHNTITTLRQLIPAIFVFVVTTCWLPGLIMPRLFWFYGGLLLLYLLAAKWFTFRKVEQWHHFFIYMLCFFTLHFAYGFGYLKGIFHFLILRKKSGEESQTMLSR